MLGLVTYTFGAKEKYRCTQRSNKAFFYFFYQNLRWDVKYLLTHNRMCNGFCVSQNRGKSDPKTLCHLCFGPIFMLCTVNTPKIAWFLQRSVNWPAWVSIEWPWSGMLLHVSEEFMKFIHPSERLIDCLQVTYKFVTEFWMLSLKYSQCSSHPIFQALLSRHNLLSLLVDIKIVASAFWSLLNKVEAKYG